MIYSKEEEFAPRGGGKYPWEQILSWEKGGK